MGSAGNLVRKTPRIIDRLHRRSIFALVRRLSQAVSTHGLGP